MERVAQGGTIVFTGIYEEGDGDLVDPGIPLVDIIDANGNSLVIDDIPTETAFGNFSYTYAVPVGAPVGIWRIHWTGVIEGAETGGDEWFQVTLPGAIDAAPCATAGPCSPWDLTLACLDDTGDLADACIDGTTVVTAILEASILSASQVVWALTGRQFSACDVTIRPCRRMCADAAGFGGWGGWQGPQPVQIGGAWFNMACSCGSVCSCGDLCEAALPYPACSINMVKVDGAVLPPTAYRVDNFRSLVRTDGECWPVCQDMAAPDTEEGTWSVSLTYGKEPPQLALDAASELACELLKARLGQTCRLPQRMASLTRQGVTMSFIDPMSFFSDGRTGLYLLDLAVRTFNPRMLQRPAGVYSPDAPGWRVTTS